MTSQAQKILEILQDGQKHCPIDWGYSDGHGKRLTDINRYLKQFGKTLACDWCDCGRHTAKIKMRWLASALPDQLPEATQTSESTQIYTKSTQTPATGQISGKYPYHGIDPKVAQAPLFTYRGLPIEH